MKKFWLFLVGIIAFTSNALADVDGSPHAWGWAFQKGYTDLNRHMDDFNSFITVIITIIVVVVMSLMLYIIIRFNARRNPVPSKTTHNTALEVIWTIIPIIIVVMIIIPSMKLLYYVDRIDKADMTLKVVGYQWYWGYELPDQKVPEFESHLVPEKNLKPGQKRMLEVDEPLVLPVGKAIRVLVTGDPLGVIHAWGIPSLSIKRDGVPGRINEGWLKIDRPGIYYGQCYELCGPDHGFMPVKVIAVSEDKFNQWVISKGGTPKDFSAKSADKTGAVNGNGSPLGGGTASDSATSGNTGSHNAIKNDRLGKAQTDLPTANNKASLQGEAASGKAPVGQAGDSKQNNEADKPAAGVTK